MKKNLCRVFIAALSLSLLSCDKEFDENSSDTTVMNYKSIDGIQVVNGRLKFTDVESLREIFAECTEKSEELFASELEDYFNQGFVSLRPIVTEENEMDMFAIYDPLLQESSLREDKFEVFDDIEKVIGDDTFAAMLNWQGEIAVADKIYKYTDVGLFVTIESEYDELLRYLDNHNISPLPAEPTEPGAGELLLQQLGPGMPGPVPCNSSYQLQPDLTFYSVEPECIDVPYEPTNYTSSPSDIYSDPEYQQYVNQLQHCGDPSTGIFFGVFGENWRCIDKYQDKRRVKTKAYNYNYVVVQHTGAKVKHQYKNIFWRKEDAVEMRLVIEAAQFEFDFSSAWATSTKRNFYTNNTKVAFNPYNNMYTQVPFDMEGLPKIFRNDLSIDFPTTGDQYLDNMFQNGIDDATEAAKLNEYFYNGLYNGTQLALDLVFGDYVTPNNRTFLATYPSFGKAIIQQSHHKHSTGKAMEDKTFHFGGALCYKADAADPTSGTPEPCETQYSPTNFKVKITAGIKDGDGNWHGSIISQGIN